MVFPDHYAPVLSRQRFLPDLRVSDIYQRECHPMAKNTFDRIQFENRSFLFALLTVSLLFLLLMKPFFGAIFWACALGLIFYPFYLWLMSKWRDRRNFAALATLLFAVVIFVVPVLFIFISFFEEGANLYLRVQSGELDLGYRIEQVKQAFPVVQQFIDKLPIDLNTIIEKLSGAVLTGSQFLAQNAVQLGQGTVQFFVQLAIMLYLLFFMLRDGKALIELLVRALPLGDERERLLFDKFADVTRATVKGSLAVAAAQGALGGLIFWLLGISGALLWGVVMMFLSLVPVIGASLVWLPVAIYLFATGAWAQGLILISYGIVVIGMSDNLLRPLLLGKSTKIPDWLILLSSLGGFTLFGANGFIVGPLVAALFMAFWGIFIREFNTQPEGEM